MMNYFSTNRYIGLFSILVFATSLSFIPLPNIYAQNQAPDWQTELKSTLKAFKECEGVESHECLQLIGRAFEQVYNINDFYTGENKSYNSVNEQAKDVINKKGWAKLGPAYDSKVLKTAQDIANSKQAVIAVYQGNDGNILHVAMILPGDLSPSGSWGTEVPNSASFFAPVPEKSYVGAPLSYAFEKRMLLHVTLYAKNI